MGHSYSYLPCMNCGQVVAHTKSGSPLHMHDRSAKCDRIGKLLRKHNIEVDSKGGFIIPMDSPIGDAFLNDMLKKSK